MKKLEYWLKLGIKVNLVNTIQSMRILNEDSRPIDLDVLASEASNPNPQNIRKFLASFTVHDRDAEVTFLSLARCCFRVAVR